MRLSSIILNEAITKSDFFDLQVLSIAASESQDPEIKKRLRFEIDYIFKNHMRQLGLIIVNKLQVADLNDAAVEKAFVDYGLSVVNNIYGGVELVGVDKLSINQCQSLIRICLRSPDPLKYFPANSWINLGEQFLSLSSAVSETERLLAIDRFYSLNHNNGMFSDHMSEYKWLENALHFRHVADLQQMLKFASSDVRSLVGNAINRSTTPIDNNKILEVALSRYSVNTIVKYQVIPGQNSVVVTEKLRLYVSISAERKNVVIVDAERNVKLMDKRVVDGLYHKPRGYIARYEMVMSDKMIYTHLSITENDEVVFEDDLVNVIDRQISFAIMKILGTGCSSLASMVNR